MQAPLRYPCAMGELGGKPSFLLYSVRGFIWENIPKDLLNFLRKAVQSNAIRHFALGCSGRYYVCYEIDGKIRCETSPGFWSFLNQDLHGGGLRALTFGHQNRFYGTKAYYSSPSGSRSVYKHELFGSYPRSLGSKIQELGLSAETIDFVALGFGDSWVLGVNGICHWKRIDGKLEGVLKRAVTVHRWVQNVVLSPSQPSTFLVEYRDGGHSVEGLTVFDGHERFTSHLDPGPSTRLRLLLPNDPWYKYVTKEFIDGWLHSHKPKPDIKAVYAVKNPQTSIEAYRAYELRIRKKMLQAPTGSGKDKGEDPVTEVFEFHGTRRQCTLGDDLGGADLCLANPYDAAGNGLCCSLCSILREGYNVQRAGKPVGGGRVFTRFGFGIYSSAVSSKADDYAENRGVAWTSTHKVMLLNRIVIGKAFQMKKGDQALQAPPAGYDAIVGVPGEDLNYGETVVYNNKAVLPVFMIVYGPPAARRA
ncbi:hypothetical protein FRB99_001056 [Tulasnella sp. 403]|nr:hypothetical protein FRB99_001056 [Tulasnella sp. 403]